MNLKSKLLVLALVAALPMAVSAEEGGSGHYMPGSMASFIDTVPGAPVFVTRLNALTYNGSVDPTVTLPFAGRVIAGADVDVTGFGLTLVFSPEINMPDKWNYAMSATIPMVNMHLTGTATPVAGGPTINVKDSEVGLGDLVLQPIMLNYQSSPDFAITSRLTVYAPTGDYTKGKLANTGKNYWSYEPTVSFFYFGKKNGREAALYLGTTFNGENDATDYKSGTQFHAETTLAQHFPLAGGLAGVGLTGAYYRQIGNDTGDGATFGRFRSKSVSAGPAISYIGKMGGHPLSAELKWLNEFEVNNRLEGDTIFFKATLAF